ncbi:MAG: hypothetical protein ACLT98_06230 [Eggerthellaceae bacterium]
MVQHRASEQTSLFMPFEMQETDNRAHPHADSEQLNIDASSARTLQTPLTRSRIDSEKRGFLRKNSTRAKTTGLPPKIPLIISSPSCFAPISFSGGSQLLLDDRLLARMRWHTPQQMRPTGGRITARKAN